MILLRGELGRASTFLVVAAAAITLGLYPASTSTVASPGIAQMTPLRDPSLAMPQHTAARNYPVDKVEMKPDLRATTFSRQNAYFFARLSKLAYREHGEAEGFLAGNSTNQGLGFDRFHWFATGEEANKKYFDAIEETEAFVAADDDTSIAVVFRATKGAADWATNIKLSWRSCPVGWNFPSPGGNAHEGFDDGVNSVWLPTGMYSTIKSLYYEKGKVRKLCLAGHSLGGALATIVAGHLAFEENMHIAAIYTFGSPRVLDQISAKHFDPKINYGTKMKDKHFRCRNNNDFVARVPPFPYDHVGTEICLDRYGAISPPGLIDRLLRRLSAHVRLEFLDGIADHQPPEYLRLFKKLAIDSDVSQLQKPLGRSL